MRTILYLGTRGCPPTLTDALDGYHEPLVILVPADPRLLGTSQDDEALTAGLEEVASILQDRALEDAVETARRGDEALADVFGQTPRDPSQRLDARVLAGDVVEALGAFFDDHRAADELYVARDALDILDDAGIHLPDALAPTGANLVAR